MRVGGGVGARLVLLQLEERELEINGGGLLGLACASCSLVAGLEEEEDN